MISVNPGLNSNPGFLSLRSQAFSPIPISMLFGVSNHQIVEERILTGFVC